MRPQQSLSPRFTSLHSTAQPQGNFTSRFCNSPAIFDTKSPWAFLGSLSCFDSPTPGCERRWQAPRGASTSRLGD